MADVIVGYIDKMYLIWFQITINCTAVERVWPVQYCYVSTLFSILQPLRSASHSFLTLQNIHSSHHANFLRRDFKMSTVVRGPKAVFVYYCVKTEFISNIQLPAQFKSNVTSLLTTKCVHWPVLSFGLSVQFSSALGKTETLFSLSVKFTCLVRKPLPLMLQ